MKKSLLLMFGLACVISANTQVIFSQNFDGPPLTTPDVPANYVSATAANATDNEFTGITTGVNSSVAIENQKLRFTRSGTSSAGWTFNRGGKDFSTIPVFLKFSVDISVIASTSEVLTAASFNIGNSFPTGTASPAVSSAHSRITLYLKGDNTFSLVPVGNTSVPAQTFASARLNWYVNNSGQTLTYIGPDGNPHSLDNDKNDVWLDNNLLPELTNYSGAGTDPVINNLKQFKFTLTSAGIGTVIDFDNFEVSMPAYTLPVKLVSFAGKNAGKQNQLSWSTSSEQNSSHFNVLRSSDGKTFSSIGTVQAAGNSGKEEFYSFTDGKPFNGINYYQLSQVDIDGHNTRSAAIMVRSLAKASRFEIFPKKNELQLSIYSSKQQAVLVNITNIAGQVVYTGKINISEGFNAVSIPIRNQVEKVNIVSLVFPDGETQSRQFLVK